MNSKLKQYFARKAKDVNNALDYWLPKPTTTPSIIHKAMRYSVFAGGKRLRPILVIAAAEACRAKAEQVMPTACALELVHTYSLIHDDLPAMDNDDLRRGRPTSHKVFGEDIAILAGDALLTHAFYLISRNAFEKGVKPFAVVDVTGLVAAGAGCSGMIAGQVADIQSDKGRWKTHKSKAFPTPEILLDFIHQNKTSALIQASLLAGGRLARASHAKLMAINIFGKNLGMAFQIVDDILDRVGDKKKLGKKGSDLANKKLTYPALYGVEDSHIRATGHIIAAHRALKNFHGDTTILHDIADYLLERDH